MSDRSRLGVSEHDVRAFLRAYGRRRWRGFWPPEPADYYLLDRCLDRLFEGTDRISALSAVERSLGIFSDRHDPVAAAELLLWGERQNLVEHEWSNEGHSWVRQTQEVAFIPYATPSIDVRAANECIGGVPLSSLASLEAAHRTSERRACKDHYLDAARQHSVSLLARASLLSVGNSMRGRDLCTADPTALEHLPVYKLIQVLDALHEGGMAADTGLGSGVGP